MATLQLLLSQLRCTLRPPRKGARGTAPAPQQGRLSRAGSAGGSGASVSSRPAARGRRLVCNAWTPFFSGFNNRDGKKDENRASANVPKAEQEEKITAAPPSAPSKDAAVIASSAAPAEEAPSASPTAAPPDAAAAETAAETAEPPALHQQHNPPREFPESLLKNLEGIPDPLRATLLSAEARLARVPAQEVAAKDAAGGGGDLLLLSTDELTPHALAFVCQQHGVGGVLALVQPKEHGPHTAGLRQAASLAGARRVSIPVDDAGSRDALARALPMGAAALSRLRKWIGAAAGGNAVVLITAEDCRPPPAAAAPASPGGQRSQGDHAKQTGGGGGGSASAAAGPAVAAALQSQPAPPSPGCAAQTVAAAYLHWFLDKDLELIAQVSALQSADLSLVQEAGLRLLATQAIVGPPPQAGGAGAGAGGVGGTAGGGVGGPRLRLFRVPFRWTHKGKKALLVGDPVGGWDQTQELAVVGGALGGSDEKQRLHEAVLTLPAGAYSFKFIVDGGWTDDPGGRHRLDSEGNRNNFLEVSELSHEACPEGEALPSEAAARLVRVQARRLAASLDDFTFLPPTTLKRIRAGFAAPEAPQAAAAADAAADAAAVHAAAVTGTAKALEAAAAEVGGEGGAAAAPAAAVVDESGAVITAATIARAAAAAAAIWVAGGTDGTTGGAPSSAAAAGVPPGEAPAGPGVKAGEEEVQPRPMLLLDERDNEGDLDDFLV